MRSEMSLNENLNKEEDKIQQHEGQIKYIIDIFLHQMQRLELCLLNTKQL